MLVSTAEALVGWDIASWLKELAGVGLVQRCI